MSSDLREITSNAIRFWERARLLYNVILAAVVAICFVQHLPGSSHSLSLDGVLGFFVLAVIANVLFCVAYLPDIFAQLCPSAPSGYVIDGPFSSSGFF